MHATAQVKMSGLPAWLPEAAQHYLIHTEAGLSIRAVARLTGLNPSTVSRQVRRLEARRDDPLVDEGLRYIGGLVLRSSALLGDRKGRDMKHQLIEAPDAAPSEEMIAREGRRILRRLCETGAVLAVAKDMEKAVVVRDTAAGETTKTAVVDRPVAQAMALKDWITCDHPDMRIARSRITAAGRAALKRLLAEAE